jgi:uncharacterized protein (DUF302 family)
LEKARKSFEMIRKIEIERFSLTSSKPFDQVVAALNAAIGHPDMAEFGRSTHEARSFAELKRAVEKGLSKAGLMLFMQLDQGAVLQERNRSRHTSNHPFAYRQPTHHERDGKAGT